MWTRAACLLFALLAPPALPARAEMNPDRLERPLIVVDYGVICDYAKGQSPDMWLFDTRSRVVPIRKGVAFGFNARLEDGSPDMVLNFTSTHPPFRPGDVTETSFTRQFTADGINGALFVFEYPWEEQQGDWLFQLTDAAGRILYQQTFVTLPENQAAEVCGPPAVTS